MRHDAFDHLHCPFDYTAELQKAREALNARVGEYVSKNQMVGYRELAKSFGLSPATLCAIAKKYSGKRKRGRRSLPKKVIFDVRHKVGEKDFMTRVTVVPANARNASVDSLRSLVAKYYKTNDISVANNAKTERHVEFAVRELEQLVISASVNEKKGQRMP
jgi:hypothetical protein